ncbi:Zc3h12a-like ribonuclease NYN domain-containing protein [Pavlovales sp. CCMP2436]|nr:Zc3h12a-like ribonuclease NYN domain-containing protein [Pavlovales sp. CCMP2436]
MPPVRASSHRPRNSERTVVVDGANVAYNYAECLSGWTAQGPPNFYGAQLCAVELVKMGAFPCVVVHKRWMADFSDRYAVHSQQSQAALAWLRDEGYLTLTPGGADDDSFSISYAQQQQAPIVTNDKYSNHMERTILSREFAKLALNMYSFSAARGDKIWTPEEHDRLPSYVLTGIMVPRAAGRDVR